MKNKGKRITWILFLIASICFLISAILNFISHNDMAIMNLGLGICFFCLFAEFAVQDRKSRKVQGKKDDKKDISEFGGNDR